MGFLRKVTWMVSGRFLTDWWRVRVASQMWWVLPLWLMGTRREVDSERHWSAWRRWWNEDVSWMLWPTMLWLNVFVWAVKWTRPERWWVGCVWMVWKTFLPPPKGEKIEKSASEFLVEKVSEYLSEVSLSSWTTNKCGFGKLYNVVLYSIVLPFIASNYSSLCLLIWLCHFHY